MNDSYLGKGWSFPPVFDRVSGQVNTVVDQEDIEDSLKILLVTRPGERLLRPRYGINLDELLFEPITTTLLTSVKDQIKQAIILYEPRIKLLKVDLRESRTEEGLVLINIEYKIRQTNSRFNFVYPFYLNEKTERL